MKLILTFIIGLAFVVFVGGYLVLKMPAFGKNPEGERKKKLEASKQYSKELDIFINRTPDVIEKMNQEARTLSTLLEWFKPGKDREPNKKLPEIKPDLQAFISPSEDIKAIWLGHSSFLLNLSGKIILVDPVLSESASPFSFMVKRFQPPVLGLEELPKIDYIVISHDHYDHLDTKSIKFFVDKDVKFLTPLGVNSHLIDWGIKEENTTALDWWENKIHGDIEFIATPAQHFSGRGLEQNKTLWASWVIKTKKHNIYFSGDSGYDTHFKTIGDKYGPFDIAFIENGQYNKKWQAVHVLPEEGVQAYFDLKAKRFFPVHWGMFVLSLHTWHEPVDNLLKLSKERGVNIVTPKLGEIVSVNDSYKNSTWWTELL